MRYYIHKIRYLIVLILISSCSVKKYTHNPTKINNATSGITVMISGKTKKIYSAEVSLKTEDYKQVFWTDTIKENSFGATFNVPKPGFYKLDFEGKYPKDSFYAGWRHFIPLYLENNQSYQLLPASDQDILHNRATIRSSSKIQNQLSLFEEPYWKEDTRLKEKIGNEAVAADSLLKNHHDKEYKKLMATLSRDEELSRNLFSSFTRKFALKYPASIVSTHKLLEVKDIEQHYDEYLKIYNHLDDAVKNQPDGVVFKSRLDLVEKLKNGKPFPQIAGRDTLGNEFRFDFANRKLTLVYFWASWSEQCYDDRIQLNQLYSRYHKSGFDIISVWLDTKPILWKDKIKKYGLVWPNHYSDLKAFEQSENVSRFNIKSVPENYLINSKGDIVAKNIALDSLADLLKKQNI